MPHPPDPPKRSGDSVVLFVCVENACRSLMAEAMFNRQPPTGWVAVSAGTRPALSPNPRTARMLGELGLAMPNHPPRALTPAMIESSHIRVTMGCLDHASCPARLKALEYRDWALPDPAPLGDAEFRRVRDDILARVAELVEEIRSAEPARPLRSSAQ
ncbi:MAG: arsenate-mycothiol transferase ArsC [Thermoplasmata archaeon]